MGDYSPVAEFKRRWSEQDSPPDVFSYLAQTQISDNRQRADILLCDQYQRWKLGIAIPVEEYFEACPELDTDENLKLELIEEEFGYQEGSDEPKDIESFLNQFSFLSESARIQLVGSVNAEISAESQLEMGIVNEAIARLSLQEKQPEKISRFKIIDAIGHGSFGVVYKGLDEELQREVAIKVPTRRRISQAGGADVFLKEARTLARLDHPSIVPIYDLGTTDDDRCYLVSKLIDGVDLKKKIGEVRSFGESARMVSAIAKALHYAHRKGLVHRDVKPANILVDRNGDPHLVDFGLALKDEDFGSGASLVGTPAYMSPEQAAGKGDRVDGRSDIYSLGVVLFELLTKRRPYRSDSGFIEQIKNGEIRPPRQIDDSIPQELDRICLTALARNPNERYSTALDFAIELDAFCESSAATASPGVLSASETLRTGFDESRGSGSGSSSGFTSSNTNVFPGATDSQSGSQSVSVSNSWLPLTAILLSLVAIGITAAMMLWPNPTEPQLSTRHVRLPKEVPTGALSSEVMVEKQIDAAKAIGVETEIRLADRLVLRLIPAGSFQMGSSRDEIDLLPLDDWFFKKWQKERMYHESPRHPVKISEPFYMSAHETTLRQFKRFVDSTQYKTTAEKDPEGGYGWKDGAWSQSPEFSWRNVGFDQGDEHPVCNVSWEDAIAYCKWLSKEENATFRLPTEAEWEYACRAGSTTWFHNGDRDEGLRSVGNIADQSLSKIYESVEWGRPWNDEFPFTAPVGRFQPNAFGLYDMHGNVWEWCEDWYGKKFYGQSPEVDPRGPVEEEVVAWAYEDKEVRVEKAKAKFEETNDPKDQANLEELEEWEPKIYHVFRGGGWDNYPGFCRSADRYSSHSRTIRTQWAGFRVVREVENR